ncbi:MAG: isoprenylcysteine carboxylmethyltransferase family protein [Alcaligenaceae bacterium]|nr:isoprenylcysteine carboxylmethyltransferase family protein [Alcaligenaceae bacterium]
MKALELLLPPPVVALLSGLLMWLAARLFPSLNNSWSANTLLISLFILLGLIIGLSGIVAFMRHKTTGNPKRPADASKLVNTGIYRYSRNPMYLGMLFLLVAWAVQLGNIIAILGIGFYIAYMTRFQIMPEEHALQTKFQNEYLTYKKQVRRWL